VRADRLAGLTVPATLTGLLQARLDGLPRPEREALQRAAVVGRLFWDDCVAGLLETERVAIEPTLDAIQGRELIFQREHSTFSQAGEYIFKHALLRDVAYETVLLKYRAEFHGKVARWLEENAGERIGEYLGVIAEHFAQAGEFDRAADYQQQSGEQALRAAAFRPARAAFERVLRVNLVGCFVTAQAAARGEDTVARHQDRDRVRTAGAPHRSRRFGPANSAGHLAVTEGSARRDVSQLPPNLLLERGAG